MNKMKQDYKAPKMVCVEFLLEKGFEMSCVDCRDAQGFLEAAQQQRSGENSDDISGYF